jgi:hypothetical protein
MSHKFIFGVAAHVPFCLHNDKIPKMTNIKNNQEKKRQKLRKTKKVKNSEKMKKKIIIKKAK